MAKKKINIKSVTSDVPSGDVNITYKNVRIAGLSESTTAVLETEDTICEDDIEVEYTKPETGMQMGNISIVNNSRNEVRFNPVGSFVYVSNNTYYGGITSIDTNQTFTGYYIPRHNAFQTDAGIFIPEDVDIYTVMINDIPINFNGRDGGYGASVTVNNYENITITIADKQV